MIIVLLAANVGVYLYMAVATGRLAWGGLTLRAWGGNLGDLTLHGQPWRLFSAMFVHASPMHLLGNMVLLLITGAFFERKIGSARFLAVYLLCGLAASLASALGHPDVVSIGASGAIAGLLGCLTVLKLSGRAAEVSSAWMWQIIIVNGLYSFSPEVDGLAHLGGFVAGLLIGLVAGRALTPRLG